MDRDEGKFYKKPMEWYAIRLKNKECLKKSQSGGALYALEKTVLQSGGIIYGCVYEGKKVVHARIDTILNLYKLQGSKYVQSDLGDCYRNVLRDLNESEQVIVLKKLAVLLTSQGAGKSSSGSSDSGKKNSIFANRSF